MTTNTLAPLLSSIQNQLAKNDAAPFELDKNILNAEQVQFNKNLSINKIYSYASAIIGAISCMGFGGSVYLVFISPVPAVGLAVVSFILNRVWIHTRNREGYLLESALQAKSEEEAIFHLSKGANIYQKISRTGSAEASLIPVLVAAVQQAKPTAPMQWFATKGYAEVVAYLSLLEPDTNKRAFLATEALPYAKDIKTAQLLINLGGLVPAAKDVLNYCCKNKQFDLLRFFLNIGASLDAGIKDYKKWQESLDYFASFKSPGLIPINSEEDSVPYLLQPTPLELLLQANKKTDLSEILKIIGLPLNILSNEPIDRLFDQINGAGLRIRREKLSEFLDHIKK